MTGKVPDLMAVLRSAHAAAARRAFMPAFVVRSYETGVPVDPQQWRDFRRWLRSLERGRKRK